MVSKSPICFTIVVDNNFLGKCLVIFKMAFIQKEHLFDMQTGFGLKSSDTASNRLKDNLLW